MLSCLQKPTLLGYARNSSIVFSAKSIFNILLLFRHLLSLFYKAKKEIMILNHINRKLLLANFVEKCWSSFFQCLLLKYLRNSKREKEICFCLEKNNCNLHFKWHTHITYQKLTLVSLVRGSEKTISPPS